MDLYNTAFLNRVVDEISPAPSVFLDLFFPEVLTHDTEEVYFDKVTDKPRLTPFVHPLHEGKVVDGPGYITKSVKPAYLKDLRVHNPQKALKRRAGEALTGSLTPAQRQQANVVADLADQSRMFTRRMEVMAIEAVRDGKATIIGEGFNAVIDFGRDASLTETLAGADKWNASVDVDIPQQLEDWSQEVADFDGSVEAVIMDVKSWNLMRNNSKVQKLLDTRRGVADTSLIIEPAMAVKAGVQYKGMLGNFPIWVYTGSYIDPADGQTKKYMPDNTVVLAGRRVEGVRHFGAIMDVDVLVARERYSQSWVERNPSRRMLMLESAPLLVPYRPNSSKKITVA
jgi:hypothetical protein